MFLSTVNNASGKTSTAFHPRQTHKQVKRLPLVQGKTSRILSYYIGKKGQTTCIGTTVLSFYWSFPVK